MGPSTKAIKTALDQLAVEGRVLMGYDETGTPHYYFNVVKASLDLWTDEGPSKPVEEKKFNKELLTDGVSVLEQLGYRNRGAKKMIERVLEEFPEIKTVEELIAAVFKKEN